MQNRYRESTSSSGPTSSRTSTSEFDQYDREYRREFVHMDLQTWVHPTCGKTLIFPTEEVPSFCRFCKRDIEPIYMVELNENLHVIQEMAEDASATYPSKRRSGLFARKSDSQIARDGWLKLFCLICLWFAVMFAGGALFQHLEQDHYLDQKARYLNEVDKMKHTVNETNFDGVMSLCDRYHNLPRHNIWKLNGATFFAITVATTVGYGSHAPQTDKGKIAFIFFSIIAIGWTLLTVRKLLRVLTHCFRRTERFLYRNADLSLYQVHFIWFSFATVLIFLIFLSQAYFYAYHNKWSFLQSSYFLMTTFTTVGIGDVIPQEFMAQTGVIEHALPLLIGIAFLPVWMWALFNWIHILFVKYTFRGKRKLPDIMHEAGVKLLKYGCESGSERNPSIGGGPSNSRPRILIQPGSEQSRQHSKGWKADRLRQQSTK